VRSRPFTSTADSQPSIPGRPLIALLTLAAMFNPTAPLLKGASGLRRLALTTKMTNKGYYKGNRVGSMGRITKFGNFHIDYAKVRTYIVPQTYKNTLVSICPTVRSGIGWMGRLTVVVNAIRDEAHQEGRTRGIQGQELWHRRGLPPEVEDGERTGLKGSSKIV
jgi:hypothetical protein